MKLKVWIIIPSIVLSFSTVHAQDNELRNRLVHICHSLDGKVGIAVKHLEKGDTISIHGNAKFPMQSVFKVHLALDVLHEIDKRRISLDDKVVTPKEELLQNTWSPILKDFPDQDVTLTVRELLEYTVTKGDNNGCDILFKLLGGPAHVNGYIKAAGFNGVRIANTERELHQDWLTQFDNWSEPVTMVALLEGLYAGNLLSRESRTLMIQMMQATITGPKRIKGLLPEGTIVAHRTGMGSKNDDGVWGAVNNAGIVTLPNGDHFAIAVFITRSTANPTVQEEVIARISREVYDYYAVAK